MWDAIIPRRICWLWLFIALYYFFDNPPPQLLIVIEGLLGVIVIVVIGDSYGSECDIYSFAIIMYEVLFQILPYSDLGNSGNAQFKVAKDPNFRPTIFDLVGGDANIHPKELENKKEFVELMKKSWQHDPKARPKFEVIVDSLENLMKKMK